LAKPHLCIVSPAAVGANNGNWQTAARWARFLREAYRLTCVTTTATVAEHHRPDLIIALHARRSAQALAEYSACTPSAPSVLVLTGTDLYRDIHTDATARNALRIATRLVVLQASGLAELPAEVRSKAEVIYQSAATLRPVSHRPGSAHRFTVIMVGHLRAEKDPSTFLRACQLLRDTPIRFSHVGAILDQCFVNEVAATTATVPHYRWLGNQAHAATRQRLKRSELMVISSLMEGGANVVIEAVTSGVAVIASNISGNRGLLGDDYAGYFPTGDAPVLAALIQRCATDPDFHALLRNQCEARRTLFEPARERAAVIGLVDNLLQNAGHTRG
jgi:putative glycosyltransferase (TIGR04348 family)